MPAWMTGSGPTRGTFRGGRTECTPWGVLVSEVMLQQTPVVRVLPVWEEWLRCWPAPSDLASEPAGEAVRSWGRLGYPRRALRLHAAAVAIRDGHNGVLPVTIGFYPGQIHAFFSLINLLDSASAAVEEAGRAIRAAV